MQCCSGTACATAERQFGPAVARRDIQRYHRKGPDKMDAIAEIRRVLKPGGRVQIADIVLSIELSETARRDIDLWTG